MCKLLAYTNFEPNLPSNVGIKVNKAIQHLFYINSFGQTDGSGIMYMDKFGDYGFLKDSLPSTVLLQLNAFADLKPDLYKNTFLAAHTRYSTVGLNSYENSHPFEHGKYLGMQNGTIATGTSHKNLVPGTTSPCEVDSSSVFWSMDQQGIEATFNRYKGEGVFLFLDVESSTFNIIKNEYRTLYFAKITDYNTHLYSTDKAALQLACDRSGLTLESIAPVKNNALLTLDLQGNLTDTPMEVEAPNWGYNYGTGYNNNYNYGANWNTNRTTPAKSGTVTKLPVATSTSTSTDTIDADIELDDTDDVPLSGNEYLADCDCCASPIFSANLVYADDPEPMLARTVCCSMCVSETQKITGRSMHLITNDKKKEFTW